MMVAVESEPTLRRNTTRVRAVAYRDGRGRERPERLVTEEPMEIRVSTPAQEAAPVAITMRTPGHDFELAVGFLYGEGVISGPGDVVTVRYCSLADDEPQLYNVVSVALNRAVDMSALARSFYATSSCGICGKASLESLEQRCNVLPASKPVPVSRLVGLPDELRRRQRIFSETGGLHAAGLYDRDGGCLGVREDVGRHNALDKLVGYSLLRGDLPLSDAVAVVSGRLSFELIQKAAMAGIPVICAVSAPSSLAVETADGLGMTVVGFVRDGGCNIYSHPERVDLEN
jgi:FdhD protein